LGWLLPINRGPRRAGARRAARFLAGPAVAWGSSSGELAERFPMSRARGGTQRPAFFLRKVCSGATPGALGLARLGDQTGASCLSYRIEPSATESVGSAHRSSSSGQPKVRFSERSLSTAASPPIVRECPTSRCSGASGAGDQFITHAFRSETQSDVRFGLSVRGLTSIVRLVFFGRRLSGGRFPVALLSFS